MKWKDFSVAKWRKLSYNIYGPEADLNVDPSGQQTHNRVLGDWDYIKNKSGNRVIGSRTGSTWAEGFIGVKPPRNFVQPYWLVRPLAD
jgi:hypothetical protein